MAFIVVDKVGEVGIVKETSPWQLPPNVWSDGNNVKTEEGSIKKTPGYSEVMATCPVAPYHLMQLTLGLPEFWVACGLTAIYAYDNTSSSTLLNGAIASTDGTGDITVDSTVGFEDSGTITVGTENISYTAKTTTTFTGTIGRGADSTTGALHDDDSTVTRAKKWYNITRSSGAYSAISSENWTSTIIGGVLVLTNNRDKPQYWDLTLGVPLSATLMQDLSNWPSLTLLNGAITGTGVPSPNEVVVDSTVDFPPSGSFQVDTEAMSYTSKEDDKFIGIGRGESGTTPATHLDNAPLFVNVYAKSIRAFRSFLIALNIKRGGVSYPRLVKWSTEAGIQGVPSSWNETTSTVDAGEYELADSKGDILDGLQLRDTFMIYKEDATYSMSFVGTPFIFSFRQLSPTIGAIAKNCVAEFDGGHAIFGKGNFYINDGQRLKPILPQKLKEYVFTTIDGAQINKCFVAADYGRTEILFCFTADGAASDEPNKAVVWNYITNTFCIRDLPDVAHMGYGNVGNPTTATTWAATTTLWDTIEGPWTMSYDLQDKVLLFADATNTKLYRDRSGNQEGTTNMVSYVERTGLIIDENGRPDQTSVKHITSIWPKMSTSSTNKVFVYLGTQMSTQDGVTWGDPVEFVPNSMSKVSVRGTGKLYAVKFESTTDMEWELDGYTIEVKNAGRRGTRMST